MLGTTFKVRIVEAADNGKAALTHYVHNHKNGVSGFYKKDAIAHIQKALEIKYPKESIDINVAESALQYIITDFKQAIPFPPPIDYKFTFIDRKSVV